MGWGGVCHVINQIQWSPMRLMISGKYSLCRAVCRLTTNIKWMLLFIKTEDKGPQSQQVVHWSINCIYLQSVYSMCLNEFKSGSHLKCAFYRITFVSLLQVVTLVFTKVKCRKNIRFSIICESICIVSPFETDKVKLTFPGCFEAAHNRGICQNSKLWLLQF